MLHLKESTVSVMICIMEVLLLVSSVEKVVVNALLLMNVLNVLMKMRKSLMVFVLVNKGTLGMVRFVKIVIFLASLALHLITVLNAATKKR
jgi:hypothetical protein